MSDTKHTPEPWVAVGKGVYTPIPMSHQIVSAFHQSADDMTAEANAERIVACVNACQGINPEAVPMMLEAAKAMRPAALSPDIQDWVNALDNLDAAIARVTNNE